MPVLSREEGSWLSSHQGRACTAASPTERAGGAACRPRLWCRTRSAGERTMSATINFDDIKLEYLGIAEARQRSGLRLILGAYSIPGPWREACKSLFDVKGLRYAAVRASN